MRDLENIKILSMSVGWKELVEEIDSQIDIELQKLKRCDTTSLTSIQARIYALETLKSLPSSMLEREA